MKIIKKFKNNELLTFTEDNYQNLIKISIDDNYYKCSIRKGYKMNLIDSSKGSYKGSFMNNYICKKFRSNQKLNIINIETNKILNYCQYFLLSKNEYINYFPKNVEYDYYWFLRSPSFNYTSGFIYVCKNGTAEHFHWTDFSYGFAPFFMKRKGKK